jgi:peptidoglycan/xylan/chitin deacetylase (PgdA/CDA1 family)
VRKFGIGLLTLALTFMPLSHGVFAATPPANMIANNSLETSANSTDPDNWFASNWGVNTASLSYEATGHTGTHSAKASISAYTDGAANWYFGKSAAEYVDVSPNQQYQYSHYYKSDVETTIGVEVIDTTQAKSNYYVTTLVASPTDWTKAAVEFTTPANAKSVTFYQALAKVGYVQIDDASLTPYVPSGLSKGIVSVTLDDGWRDQYTAGRPIMNQNGIKSTYYLLTNTVNDSEYMTTAQMADLGADGNELASHTVHHCNLSQSGNNTDDPTNCPVPLPLNKIDSELQNSQTQLRTWFGATNAGVADNFATPYGAYDTQSLTEIKKFYKSHRSTDEGFNSKDNFDVYNIKVQNVLDNTTPAQVQAWVDQAAANKTWLVLVYHRIGVDGNGEDYNVSTANLATEMAYIKSKVTAGQIANLTVAQGIAEMQGQVVTPPVTKPGDVNGDNVIDALDLSLVLSNWNKTSATKAQGDLNADGTVDALDLSLVLANWSK